MDPFLGEIRLMGFGITPKGWLPCQGQLLPINSNQALFTLLGITYGGNGTTNFGLPDLRGRSIVGMGQGSGLANYTIGQKGGTESQSLLQSQMPGHTHTVSGTLKAASASEGNSPSNSYPASTDDGTSAYSNGAPNATMSAGMISGPTTIAGGGLAHENRQPVMALNYCIAIAGIFPPRS